MAGGEVVPTFGSLRMEVDEVFWTISVILFVLWVLGMVAGSTVGAWIHLMFVFALFSTVLAVASQGKTALKCT